MQEKSTDELDAQLRNTTPDCMDKYLYNIIWNDKMRDFSYQ